MAGMAGMAGSSYVVKMGWEMGDGKWEMGRWVGKMGKWEMGCLT